MSQWNCSISKGQYEDLFEEFGGDNSHEGETAELSAFGDRANVAPGRSFGATDLVRPEPKIRDPKIFRVDPSAELLPLMFFRCKWDSFRRLKNDVKTTLKRR